MENLIIILNKNEVIDHTLELAKNHDLLDKNTLVKFQKAIETLIPQNDLNHFNLDVNKLRFHLDDVGFPYNVTDQMIGELYGIILYRRVKDQLIISHK